MDGERGFKESLHNRHSELLCCGASENGIDLTEAVFKRASPRGETGGGGWWGRAIPPKILRFW